MPTKPKRAVRLDALVAAQGVPRSQARKLVASGKVRVDGRVCTDPAFKVTSQNVLLDGREIALPGSTHLMLNKPPGVVTATRDAAWPTVIDCLPASARTGTLSPVGRLDRDVTGLVLLTDDGDLLHRVISPRNAIEKEYELTCEGALDPSDADLLSAGVPLGDFVAAPARLDILESDEAGSRARVVLTEGKFHEVKRLFSAIGHPLKSLRRVRIGPVVLDEALGPGEFRPLRPEEREALERMAGGSDTAGGLS